MNFGFKVRKSSRAAALVESTVKFQASSYYKLQKAKKFRFFFFTFCLDKETFILLLHELNYTVYDPLVQLGWTVQYHQENMKNLISFLFNRVKKRHINSEVVIVHKLL